MGEGKPGEERALTNCLIMQPAKFACKEVFRFRFDGRESLDRPREVDAECSWLVPEWFAEVFRGAVGQNRGEYRASSGCGFFAGYLERGHDGGGG